MYSAKQGQITQVKTEIYYLHGNAIFLSMYKVLTNGSK